MHILILIFTNIFYCLIIILLLYYTSPYQKDFIFFSINNLVLTVKKQGSHFDFKKNICLFMLVISVALIIFLVYSIMKFIQINWIKVSNIINWKYYNNIGFIYAQNALLPF